MTMIIENNKQVEEEVETATTAACHSKPLQATESSTEGKKKLGTAQCEGKKAHMSPFKVF